MAKTVDADASEQDSRVHSWTKCRHGMVVLLLALLSGYFHYTHIKWMHEKHSRFSHLSTLERELFFRTELGFYYSFYKQVHQAPTFVEGVNLLMHDNLTEVPNTINALERFNIYPEIVLGLAYRSARPYLSQQCFNVDRGDKMPPVTSCEGLAEPTYFYVEAVFLLSGFMMAGLFLLANQMTGDDDVWGGLVMMVGVFLHTGECTRVMWAPPLRENFAFPFFVWQQLATLQVLQKPTSRTRLGWLSLMSLLFMLPWQLAQFITTVQVCALFGCYLLGSVDAAKLRQILMCFLVAVVLSVILQFGNTMLVAGILPASLLSAVMLSYVPLHRYNLYARFVAGVGLLVVLTVTVKFSLGIIANGGEPISDESHIWQLLLAKFDASRHNFDTKLYLCSAEFGFYDPATLLRLGIVVPAAVWSILTLVLTLPTIANDAVDKAMVQYVLLLLAAFTALAGLIARLKLFFTPQLILVVSLLLHKRLSPVRVDHRARLALALIVGMYITSGVFNIRQERSMVGEYSNFRLEDVVFWILDNTSPLDSFVGPMTLMATIRETTMRPVYNHPHYESAQLRNRTRHAYVLYSRKPVQEIWRIHTDIINTTYVLVEAGLCNRPTKLPNCRYTDIYDTEDKKHIGNSPVCEHLLYSGSLEPYFQTVYKNGEFMILQAAGSISSEDVVVNKDGGEECILDQDGFSCFSTIDLG